VSSNPIKKKFLLNYHIQCRRVPILFLISITLVSSSSLYLLPLAYSQELSFIPIFREGGGSPEAKLKGPEGIAVDQEGKIYVADTANNRIEVFSSNTTLISKWGEHGAASGSFNSPTGIAIDPSSGNVYVADTANNRIQVFSSNGTFISKWGEFGGSINGSFSHPQGIAIDPSSSNVYVADTANNRIQVFSSNGTFISKFPRQWGEYGPRNGTLTSPEGIAIDQEGNVYVADTANNRIQVFSSNGTFISAWGEYGTANSMLRSPKGIAIDQEGNVYVADTANHRIQVFSSNGTFISKWGEYGFTAEGMRFPEGIAIDPSSGNVYVADTASGRFLAFTSHSPITNVSFSSKDGEIYGNDTRIKIEPIYEGLKFPTAIAFLGPNDMLVVQKINASIMRIVNGQMLDEPVLDLGNTVKFMGASCMCDIAILHNDNGRTYAFLYYYMAEVTEDDGTKKVVNHLYRYDVTNGKFTNPKLIFEIPSVPFSPHNGGKLMVGPDNNIYLTIGDINHYRTKAQNNKNGSLPDGSSGILRFTPNGDPVDGGGIFGDTHPLDKYYVYGIRNSFGLNYDPFTGNIWMTDNGPANSDELNIVPSGFNGGWRKIMGLSSLREGFNLTDLEFFNGTGKYYDPVFTWYEPVGVTDLVFFPSDTLGKEYEGNLFVADNNNGYLYRFLLNQSRTGLLLNGSLSDGVANTSVEKLETAFGKINGGGITDLEIGPDGLVYIVSLGSGKIMRLEPIDTNATETGVEANMTATETGNATGTTTGATGGGGATIGVSIVPDSTTLTDTAYQPNPVQINVGDTVTWTNDDAQPHTVTSSANAQPDGQFDSNVMDPQQTFEHTFTEAGEYPYFCILHPNMVGTVSVMS
jgi:DNA-binding beta-propeller fold protein YncE/glucose/arabinose dehydrogenase/plastocyanin